MIMIMNMIMVMIIIIRGKVSEERELSVRSHRALLVPMINVIIVIVAAIVGIIVIIVTDSDISSNSP